MVKIKLFDNNNKENKNVANVEDLLPTIRTVVRNRETPPKSKTVSLGTSILFFIVVLITLTTVKQVCDLKEQNAWLIQQLALEKQKDAALKLAIKQNIPEDKFVNQNYSPNDVNLMESESQIALPNSSWSINLSVLWTSPTISRCEMGQLAHMLVEEIYVHKEDLGILDTPTEEIVDYGVEEEYKKATEISPMDVLTFLVNNKDDFAKKVDEAIPDAEYDGYLSDAEFAKKIKEAKAIFDSSEEKDDSDEYGWGDSDENDDLAFLLDEADYFDDIIGDSPIDGDYIYN